MITLYGAMRSRATRPAWVLEEIGLDYRQVPVIQASRLADPLAPDAPLNTASAAVLAANPMGQIPYLDDDGFVVTESLAIALYLARRHGGTLAPQDPREEAQTLQWTLLAATAIEPAAMVIVYAVMRGEADTPAGQAAIAEAAVRLQRPLAWLDAHLATRDWLVGDRFTVADIYVAEVIRYAQGHAPALAPFEQLLAWLARCQARPAFQSVWAKRLAEPV